MTNLELNIAYKAKEFFIGVIDEEPAKSTNSKKRQIKLAEEKCKFYTTGTGRGMKYVITEIYSHQRVKLNGKYAEDMKTVLIYLLQNKDRNIVAPRNLLMKDCGFVNEEYLNASKNKKKTAKELEVLLSSVVLFYQNVNNLLGQAIKRTISYLEDASYIIVRPKKRCKFTIVEISSDKDGNIVYENGYQKKTKFDRYMIMNEEQEEFLSDAIRYALDEYNFEKQSDVYKDVTGKKNLFYNRVNELISNNLVNYYIDNILYSEDSYLNNEENVIYEVKFDYYYDVYDIKANKFIEDFKISEVEYRTALKNINELSLNAIDGSINNHNKIQKKASNIFVLNALYKEENSIERLLEDTSLLSDKLLKLNVN